MNVGSINALKCLACNLQSYPIHDRVVANPQYTLNGSQPHALGIQAQGLLTQGVINTSMVVQAKSALAVATQIALVSVATDAVLDCLRALAMDAVDSHGRIVSILP